MTSTAGEIVTRGERLRRALRWLSDEGRHDAAAIEDACRRFDLSPLDEDFLFREAARLRKLAREDGGSAAGRTGRNSKRRER